MLHEPTLTHGTPVHLAVAPEALARHSEGVDKLFLDWWLLARSRVLVHFRAEMLREPRNQSVNPLADPHEWTSATNPNGNGFLSSFVATATLFRDASSSHGRAVKLSYRSSSHGQASRAGRDDVVGAGAPLNYVQPVYYSSTATLNHLCGASTATPRRTCW